MKLISIVTPCFNEEDNVESLCSAVKSIFDDLKVYQYEHIFIDNASQDQTVPILKRVARQDKNVKIIVNIRNFGQNASPCYGLFQSKGDAVILLSADFQDPLELIKKFISEWEQGKRIVVGIKEASAENFLMWQLRNLCYFLMKRLSSVPQIENFTGFGLYDRTLIDILRKFDDPSPYLRGLITEFSSERSEIKFVQPERKRGKSHNNFFTLFNLVMLGLTSYSIIPLRLSIFIGFFAALISLLIGFVYFILKLIFWNSMAMGMAPLVIGFFFFLSIQMFFIGMLGEYIGAIYTHVKRRPMVIEKERVNF